jgi:uncharacterized protein YqeY
MSDIPTSATPAEPVSASTRTAASSAASVPMATLKSRLQTDLTAAIRGREEIRTAALRMALTAVRSQEVAGEVARNLSDDEVVAVLGREAKKRREAATAFEEAGRAEQAARERDELAVLTAYLPVPLTDDDLASIVAEEVASATAGGVGGLPAMGRVMKAVQPRVAGRAEGGRVAAEVRRQLSAG